MGAKHRQAVQRSFNTSLEVDCQGSRVTSDGGVMVVRELDERLSVGARIGPHLTDSPRGQNTPFPLADLMRPSLEGGWLGTKRAMMLRGCPTIRPSGSSGRRRAGSVGPR